MMHLYEDPDHADDSPVSFPVVPRKLRTQLLVHGGQDEGRGICFVEGLSWVRVCNVGLVVVLSSTVLGVCWTGPR